MGRYSAPNTKGKPLDVVRVVALKPEAPGLPKAALVICGGSELVLAKLLRVDTIAFVRAKAGSKDAPVLGVPPGDAGLLITTGGALTGDVSPSWRRGG